MASLLPKTGLLGTRLAKHLLRRSTFQVTRQRIDEFASLSASDAVDQLMIIPAPSIPEPIDPLTNDHWINSGVPPLSNGGQQRDYVKCWWLDEARQDTSISHKMMFFLHSNFVTNSTFYNSYSAFDYLELMRYYAIGNFRILSEKMVADNLMLKYLNGDVNSGNNPNENFAREFFELFTIGKGPQQGPGDYTNYTETDIQEAARLLSGWRKGNRTINIDPDTNLPRGKTVLSQHDQGDKQFSAAFQNTLITGATTAADMWTELSEFVSMIFDQDETARFICRKLYRYFVGRDLNAEIESDIIEPLAATFRDSDYDLKETLSELLKSQHFYDEDDAELEDEIIGNMLKSPLENVLLSINFFGLDIPDPVTETINHYHFFYRRGVLQVMFSLAGMDIHAPSTVAGYPAYYQQPDFHRSWFNSSSIITRYKLPQMLLEGKRVLYSGDLGGVQLNIVSWVEKSTNISNPYDSYVLVSEMLNYMLPEYPDAEREAYFMDIFLDDLEPLDWYYEWQDYVNSGDDFEVKIPLGHLVTAIMYSPEYQLL